MLASLEHFLHSSHLVAPRRDDIYKVEGTFLTPGYWAALSAKALHDGLEMKNINLPDNLYEYSKAIGLPRVLWGQDVYEYVRRNEGVNYSPLTLLENAESENQATSKINGCIRTMLQEAECQRFVSDLCEVVGDLHNNVWSHGLSTGISMAQKWSAGVPNEQYLEFGLADCGYGFLRELQRAGIPDVQTHEQAIAWCIQEGNSTKKRDLGTAIPQRLPSDYVGNPIPGECLINDDGNHHMGLGLSKLVSLVRSYRGRLWIASGTHILSIDSNGSQRFESIGFEWTGVAMACRFHSAAVKVAANGPVEPEIRMIMDRLRRV